MLIPSQLPASRPAPGFTLAECMLSVAITATSLLAVVGMLMGTLDAAQDSKEETVSGVLIRQLAGELRELQPPAASEAVSLQPGRAGPA